MKKRTCVLIALLLVPGLLAAGEKKNGEKTREEKFTGYVVRMSGPSALNRLSSRINVSVKRWTTPEEKQVLLSALLEGGPDAMMKALEKMKPVGSVSIDSSLGWRCKFATSVMTENGRRVRIVTDRPVFFAELKHRTRSRDYELGVVDFTLNEEGKGEGVLIPAARINFNKDGELEIEIHGTGPQKLLNVRQL
jgi:hypothetical protein